MLVTVPLDLRLSSNSLGIVRFIRTPRRWNRLRLLFPILIITICVSTSIGHVADPKPCICKSVTEEILNCKYERTDIVFMSSPPACDNSLAICSMCAMGVEYETGFIISSITKRLNLRETMFYLAKLHIPIAFINQNSEERLLFSTP